MFPEYRDLMTKLKHTDSRFTHLFDEHNALDHRIQRIEARLEPGTAEDVETLKKQKLRLKDELYAHLRSVETV